MLRKETVDTAKYLLLLSLLIGLVTQFNTSKFLQENPKISVESPTVRSHQVNSPHGMPWKVKQDESKPQNFGY